ncbi:MAG: NTP transferase domain-containing protein, partial [Deltaproteobacteria bacterium]|nr:NTP transferase domain-containing protein [Deltaproteobacteria bacterium]
MSSISTAMILAAGFGQRLQPLSKIRPKALFPVLNRTMLHYWLSNLREYGVETVVINVHYLADAIIQAVREMKDEFVDLQILVVEEKERILGTGGGIKHALKFLKGPFLIVNVDIFTDISLAQLTMAHLVASNCLATVAVVDYPTKANVSLGPGDALLGFRASKPLPGEVRRMHGAGLMVLDEVSDLPDGPSDIIELLSSARLAGAKVQVAPFPQVYWADIGTLSDYWALNAHLAQGRVVTQEKLEATLSSFVVIENGAKVSSGAFIK